jgi:TP901 family phage tail tape measure protein
MAGQSTLGSLIVNLTANTGAFTRDMASAAARMVGFSNSTKAMVAGIGGVTIALGLLAAGAIKVASEFEAAFAKVQRVLDTETAGAVASLRKELIELSTAVPVAATELANVAEIGGQMGVAANELAKFADVVSRISVAAGVSSGKVAALLGRIANVTGEGTANFDKLGSALLRVADANNSTAAEVLNTTRRLAPMGAQAGIAASAMFGFSAAIQAAGVPAEQGATAFGRVLLKMRQMVDEGGAAADKLADIASQSKNAAGEMSGLDFSRLFDDNPTEAMLLFVEGLSSVGQSGESAAKAIGELFGQNIRTINTMGGLALTADKVRAAVNLSNQAYAENTALQEKSNIVFSTTSAEWQKLKNIATAIGIGIGTLLLPVVKALLVTLNALGKTVLFVFDSLGKAWDGVKMLGSAMADAGVEGQFLGGVLTSMKDKAGDFFSAMKEGAAGLPSLLNELRQGLLQTAFGGQEGGIDVGSQFGGKGLDPNELFAKRVEGLAKGALQGGAFGEESRKKLEALVGSAEAAAWAIKQVGGASKEAAVDTEALASGLDRFFGIKDVTDDLKEMALAIENQGGLAALSITEVSSLAGHILKLGKSAEESALGMAILEERAKRVNDNVSNLRVKDFSSLLGADPNFKELDPATLPLQPGRKPKVSFEKALKDSQKETDKLRKKFEQLTTGTTNWGSVLSKTNDLMKVLGISADSTFGRILGSLSAAVAGSGMLGQSLDRAKEAFNAINPDTGEKGGLGAALKSLDLSNVIAGVSALAGALGKALDQSDDLSRSLSTAAVGASLGSALGGPVGAAIGGVAGAVLGFFKSPSWKKVGEEAGQILGTDISEEMAKKIEELAKSLDISVESASLLALPDVIAESGESALGFADSAAQLMEGVANGTIPAVEGLEAIDETFQAIRESAEGAGADGMRALAGMVLQARELGIESEKIDAFFKEMLAQAAGGLNTAFGKVGEGGVVSGDLDFTAGGTATDEQVVANASAAATIFSTTFWATVDELGIIAAAEAMGPAFEALKAQMIETGLFDEETMGQILGPIQQIFDLAGNELFAGANQAAVGLAETMEGLGNLGMLNQDSFNAFGVSAQNAFEQAVAGGATAEQAMQAMMPLLSQIVTAQQAYGFEVDAGTQSLIDQAEAMGFAFPPDPVIGLTDAIKDLIAAITGIPRDISINTKFTTSGTPPTNFNRPGKAPDEFASSGFFSPKLPKDKLIQAHAGEEVIITPAGRRKGDVLDVGKLMEAMTEAGVGGDSSQPMMVNVHVGNELLFSQITEASRTGEILVSSDNVVEERG